MLDGISFRLPSVLTFIPWLVPGIVLSALGATALAPAVGRWLRAPTLQAWLLLLGVGIVASATLTPIPGDGTPFAFCDTRRLGPPPLTDLLRVSTASLNVLLFIPLGLAVGLLPRSERSTMVAGATLALPFVVEIAQSLLPALGRGCQTGDMVDNVIGLLLGFVIGRVLTRTARKASPSPTAHLSD
jgi:hypothetical protein